MAGLMDFHPLGIAHSYQEAWVLIFGTKENPRFPELAAKYEKIAKTSNILKAYDDFKNSLDKNDAKKLNDAFKEYKKPIDEANKAINEYNKINKSNKKIEETISTEEFIKMISKPESPLFELSKKYNEVYNAVKKQGVVHLGQMEKKSKIGIDFVIAPFKFIFIF